MAKIELLLQAFGAGIHVTALKELLSLTGLTRFVASVAFVREEGVDAIATELRANAKASVFFVGIRNEITSIQAVRRLLELGVKVFAVDTASQSTLFHPKMFLSVCPGKGVAIIGSANVTFSGLHNNVEASTVIHLDPANGDDARFLKAALDSIDELPTRFPDHVFQIKTEAVANELFDQGRLTDEELILTTPPRSSIRKGERDKLKPIKLPRQASPKHGKRIRASLKAQAAATATEPAGSTPIVTSQSTDFVLIWESKALTERDLNIPTGKRTNATGSMLWKKGSLDGIDQRHFFRDEVFSKIPWKQDDGPKLGHYQRAQADFTLVIKGLNYGTHTLKLSHNTDKTSKTYQQNNGMTKVSWGPVAEAIGKRDLLGRTMSLYRNGKTPPQFLIEID